MGCATKVEDWRRPRPAAGSAIWWLRIRRALAVTSLTGLWVVGSLALQATRSAFLPHNGCCGWPTIETYGEWVSFVAVGVLMIGSYFVWRLRREVFG